MQSFKQLVVLLALLLSSVAQSKEKITLDLISSYLSSGGKEQQADLFKRVEMKSFKHEDIIFYFANFTWENIEENGGKHKVMFKWYANGRPVGAPKWEGKFETAPWELRSTMIGGTLGYGKHKIELYIDGELRDTKDFEVVQDAQEQ